jgi:hypothetical protein
LAAAPPPRAGHRTVPKTGHATVSLVAGPALHTAAPPAQRPCQQQADHDAQAVGHQVGQIGFTRRHVGMVSGGE